MNPRGQVPTFIDNGVVVCESGAAVQVRTADGVINVKIGCTPLVNNTVWYVLYQASVHSPQLSNTASLFSCFVHTMFLHIMPFYVHINIYPRTGTAQKRCCALKGMLTCFYTQSPRRSTAAVSGCGVLGPAAHAHGPQSARPGELMPLGNHKYMFVTLCCAAPQASVRAPLECALFATAWLDHTPLSDHITYGGLGGC